MSVTIADNIARVRDQIAAACARAGRSPDQVTLIAVSKTHPADDLMAAAAAGVQHFGENRVEESSIKIPQVQARLDAPVTWHMIGHVQSRKAKEVVPLFDTVHSIDTLRLAEKLARAALDADKTLAAFVEINVSGEASKSGVAAYNWQDDAEVRAALIETLGAIVALPGLQVRGLMTMAPLTDDVEAARPVFASLAALRDWIAERIGVSLPELSMGMSDDFPVAIEQGATLVRVGRAIFGERAVQENWRR
ncbi:MAG: YggS family pyridoxal phosphate-dependent enzyme [Chloroflexota bacterium]|nr:YggS family pyridoxal phosphate-dependent enzyme [Chloroflexota bacterium]